jgi:hypothetical protein
MVRHHARPRPHPNQHLPLLVHLEHPHLLPTLPPTPRRIIGALRLHLQARRLQLLPVRAIPRHQARVGEGWEHRHVRAARERRALCGAGEARVAVGGCGEVCQGGMGKGMMSGLDTLGLGSADGGRPAEDRSCSELRGGSRPSVLQRLDVQQSRAWRNV